MTDEEQAIIRRTYKEVQLAAREKGLSGKVASQAIVSATAKTASQIIGKTITTAMVEMLVRG